MTAWRALLDHFVAPDADGPVVDSARAAGRREHRRQRRRRGSAPAPAPVGTERQSAVALLCPPTAAHSAGAALALALLARERSPAGLLAVWTTRDGGPYNPGVPALGGARRLTAALDARGFVVRATGRLAVVELPVDDDEAARAAERAFAVAAPAPMVLAVGGPRGAALDRALDGQDLVVVAAEDGDELAQLAVAGLCRRGLVASVCAVPGMSAGMAAAAGFALLPSAKRSLAVALEDLP